MHFPGFVQAFGREAFLHDSVYYTAGYAGAALWLPPGVYPDEGALIRLLRSIVAEPVRNHFSTVFEQMGHYHPSEPHWYLPLIGVDLPYQDAGYGSALLRHTLARCDSDEMSAYLESTNPENIHSMNGTDSSCWTLFRPKHRHRYFRCCENHATKLVDRIRYG